MGRNLRYEKNMFKTEVFETNINTENKKFKKLIKQLRLVYGDCDEEY